jgi:hypothetical protein
MPDVEDAIEVVTDPANVVESSDTHSDMRRVNGKRALKALRDQGAGRAEARTLINDAVQELGGEVGSEVTISGRASGPDSSRATDTWSVPSDKIRR